MYNWPHPMQQSARFDRLVRGETTPLPEELPALAAHFAALPQQIMPAATLIYRHDPHTALNFLRQAAAGVDEQKQQKVTNSKTRTSIHACHSALSLSAAIHTSQTTVQLEGETMEAALKAQAVGGVACGLSRAFLYLYRGELAECLKLAKQLEEEMSRQSQTVNYELTVTQLLLAQCCFARRNYQQALEYYRKCFMRNNWLPIEARLGMAYCYFHLNKYEMARACATRVIQLSPQCADAHILLALVCQLGEEHQEYFRHLSAAYKLQPQQPLLLYLVATHLFLRDKLQQAEQLCRKAQESLKGWARWLQIKDGMRDDYAELSNRLSNLLGQIAHRRKDYAAALDHYGNAAQKGLFWNDLAMAQCLMGLQRHKDALDSLSYTYRLYDREKRDWRLLKDSYRMMAYLKAKCRSKEGQEGKQALHYYGEAIKFDKNDPLLKEHLWYLLSSLQRDNHKALRTMQELHKQLITPTPESLLNYGVLLMHNHEPEEAEIKLRQALRLIQQWEDLDSTQQQGFLLIAKYNLAICLQSANCNHAGLQLLEGILTANPLHLNALLHKALIFHKLGNRSAALQSLRTAQGAFQERVITQGQVDKIRVMEVYLLFLYDQPSAALGILKELIIKKPLCTYLKTLQFAIRWEMAKREGKEEEARVVEEGRQFFQNACKKDNTQLFCCMVAGVTRAWQGSLGKEQGTNLFKKILVSSSLSCLRYNMAIFYIQQHDPDAAVSCLNQHREHVPNNHQHPALQLIAHQYLQSRDYRRCLKAVKRAIMMQPANLSHRVQLAVATQAKCEEELASQHPNPSQVKQSHHQIQKCILIYRFCTVRAYLANMQKQCTQNASAAEYLLQRCQVQLRQMGEQAGRADGSESEGEEDRLRRQVEEKKRKALALSKLKAQTMNESWSMISEKQRVAEEDKGRKRTVRDPPTPPNATPPRRRDKRDKRDQVKTEPDDGSLRRTSKQDMADDESLSRYMVE